MDIESLFNIIRRKLSKDTDTMKWFLYQDPKDPLKPSRDDPATLVMHFNGGCETVVELHDKTGLNKKED